MLRAVSRWVGLRADTQVNGKQAREARVLESGALICAISPLHCRASPCAPLNAIILDQFQQYNLHLLAGDPHSFK
jgi:hypothetical protein